MSLPAGLHPFDLTMKVHGLLGWPAMTLREMAIIKRALLSLPRERPIQIFEYGMGFSTIYFARFLQKERRAFHIDSLDNNRFWHEKVTAMIEKAGLKDNVTLHLREFVPFWEKPGWDWDKAPAVGQFAPASKEENEYISLPVTLNKTFDLVFVDGRFRRRCLEAIGPCLAYHGFAVLHDAQKEKYHGPTGNFRYSQFLDSGRYFPFERRRYQIWLGSMANAAVDQVRAEAVK